MDKARKKFLLYAMIAVFVLLTTLLAVINIINFTMAGEDADKILDMLRDDRGQFSIEQPTPEFSGEPGGSESFRFPGGMGPMGPDSPEMRGSTMYFTFRFDKNGNVETVAFKLSAMSEDEAKELAKTLVDSGKTRGWVKTIYRFRVYTDGKSTYVTAIDQARELYPSFRILLFSVIGEVVGLIVSFLFLYFIGKRLFSPLEEADRKQKKFISEAENEFKVPLTIIEASAELIEKDHGPSEQTSAIRRQIKKMAETVEKLGALAIYSDGDGGRVDLSAMLTAALESKRSLFDEKNIAVTQNIDGGVVVRGDADAFGRVIDEIVDNTLKFSEGGADFTLKEENGRVTLKTSNKTSLGSGSVDMVFDRFTMLENAEGKGGHGLGLSYVKDEVRAVGGRVRADVFGGVFMLEITL